ncbi:MAG: hypothetical protein ACKO5F_04225 [Synechococcus sp.]
MNLLDCATRDAVPDAAELRHRLRMVHHLAVCVIKTTKGIPAAKRRQLIAALDSELADLGL